MPRKRNDPVGTALLAGVSAVVVGSLVSSAGATKACPPQPSDGPKWMRGGPVARSATATGLGTVAGLATFAAVLFFREGT